MGDAKRRGRTHSGDPLLAATVCRWTAQYNKSYENYGVVKRPDTAGRCETALQVAESQLEFNVRAHHFRPRSVAKLGEADIQRVLVRADFRNMRVARPAYAHHLRHLSPEHL